MIKINKTDINSFKSKKSIGDADASTHEITIRKKESESDITRNSFFEKIKSSESKGIASHISIDDNKEEAIIYINFNVKSKKTAQIDDIFIGFNGKEYIFSINEDVSLLKKKIEKRPDATYNYFAEKYDNDNVIPKELKFLMSKISLNEFETIHKEYLEHRNSNQKFNDNQKFDDIQKEVIISNENIKSNKIAKGNEINIENNPVLYQNTNPQVMFQQQITKASSVSQDRLAEIEKQKLLISKKILEEKKEKKKINFCNSILPRHKNDNDLVRAMREVGGRKVIGCYGPHGTGKTWTVEKYSKDLEQHLGVPVNYFSFLCEKTMDKSDIVGTPLLKDDSFSYQKMAEAFMSARDGDLTVLLIDEFLRLKEKGVLFNLFGESHYKLETGRQLEIVELLVNDIDGNPKTTHFCLLDRKEINPDVILEQANIKVLKNEENEIFKRMPIQKIKDKLSLGELPIIDRKDYIQYELELLKVSSFFTSEVIKAPIENLIIVLATNVGKDYITHAAIDDDLAFLSRLHLVEMKQPPLKDYLLKIEQELNKAKEQGYILWDNGSVDVDKEIKNVVAIATNVYTQLFKLIKQKSFSSSSYFSYRTFEEFAHTICKQEKINSETIRHCFLSQEKAVMPHAITNNSRVPIPQDLMSYRAVVDKATGFDNKKENNIIKEAGIENAITR